MSFLNMGQELQDIKFGDLILSMASAIAESQTKLDMASLNTLKVLAHTKFDFIPDITEVLSPVPKLVITDRGAITVTGVDVSSTVGDPVQMTLLQAGLTPTFYQFTESDIEIVISLKAAVSTDVSVDSGFEFDDTLTTELGFGGGIASFFGGPSGKITNTTHFAAHVNVTTQTKYSYEAQGAATLKTTLKPVAPPARVMPKFISVNAFMNPPQVTMS
ncbi:MAG TPA: hypothetical protein VKB79_23820 [Bryobacteraceae bacterium]|nr:hypothetical protein [Bryobacteraceae bacterium]